MTNIVKFVVIQSKLVKSKERRKKMEISVRYSQKERANFLAWIEKEYLGVTVSNDDCNAVSDDCAATFNELWTAYCED